MMLDSIDKWIGNWAMRFSVEAGYIAAMGKKDALVQSNKMTDSLGELVENCNDQLLLPPDRCIYFIHLLNNLLACGYKGNIISSENYNYFLRNSDSPYLSDDIAILNNWKSENQELVIKAYLRTITTFKWSEVHHTNTFKIVIEE